MLRHLKPELNKFVHLRMSLTVLVFTGLTFGYLRAYPYLTMSLYESDIAGAIATRYVLDCLGFETR
jgi:hypothetical protein